MHDNRKNLIDQFGSIIVFVNINIVFCFIRISIFYKTSKSELVCTIIRPVQVFERLMICFNANERKFKIVDVTTIHVDKTRYSSPKPHRRSMHETNPLSIIIVSSMWLTFN